MALTRKSLAAMGIEDEKIDEIIRMHTETVNGLKEERDNLTADRDAYKADAEKLAKVQKELNDMKAAAENRGENPFEVKYNALKEEFDSYREGIEKEKSQKTKRDTYRKLLKDSGVSEKRIDAVLKVSSAAIDSISFAEDGTVNGEEDIKAKIVSEWEDFIETTETHGAKTDNPPKSAGGSEPSEMAKRAAELAKSYHDGLYGSGEEKK